MFVTTRRKITKPFNEKKERGREMVRSGGGGGGWGWRGEPRLSNVRYGYILTI